jgi:hypothetical protein
MTSTEMVPADVDVHSCDNSELTSLDIVKVCGFELGCRQLNW